MSLQWREERLATTSISANKARQLRKGFSSVVEIRGRPDRPDNRRVYPAIPAICSISVKTTE